MKRDGQPARRATSALRRAILLATLASCSTATAPITYFSPQLANLTIDPIFSALRDSGIVVLSALPADTLTRPGPTQRVRVYVRSAAGDSESLDLGPVLCGELAVAYFCSDLGVTMRSGHHATELQQTLDQIGARFWMVSVSGSFAGVWVFDRTRVDAAIRRLSAEPAVRAVERDFVVWAGTPSRAAFAKVNGALPLDFVPAARGDGRLQSQAHDTLRLSYVQPDGTLLARVVALP